MNEARYLTLKCEQMIWTRHTDAVFGKRPVAKDEIVKVVWDKSGGTPPIPAGDCNWGHMYDGVPNHVKYYDTCEPRFPELCKETEAKAKGSQQIGEFLEWLQEQGLVLAEWANDTTLCVSQRGASTGNVVAEFFGIDVKKAEAERQQLLDEFVASQQEASQ